MAQLKDSIITGDLRVTGTIYGNVDGGGTAAAIATTTNAVAYFSDAVGTFSSKPSASGALYATSTNGTLNFGTLPVAQGGTGATSSASARTNLGLGTMATEAAANYIKKSTLSGAYDIMYSSAANTPTRLGANTTTTKKFLRMTGTGSAGAAPAWDTITAADLPIASATVSGIVSTGTQTFAGAKTFSGATTLSGTTTIKGTTTISGATTISGNFTTTGSTVTMSASTSITLQANEVRIRNSAANNTQAGTKGYITELTLGDSRFTRLTEYNDDDLEVRGSSILLNTGNMTPDVQAYSNTTTYAVGASVWYNSYYYVCKEAIATAEAWTASHWTQMPLVSNAVMINGDTLPWKDNTYNLGNNTYKWKSVYATTFIGTLSGRATGANITTTANAVAYYSNTTGTFSSKASANGALYATSANGTLTFGTLPVGQGGTGMTAATNTNAVVVANASSTTGAMTTVRSTSGAFYSTGNDVKPTFGTLPVAQGGTGATTVTQYGVVYGSSTTAYSSVKATAANQVLLATATNAAPTWKGINAHTYTYPTGATSRTANVALTTATFTIASVSGEVLTILNTSPTYATGAVSTQPTFSVTTATANLTHAFA